MNPLSVLKDGPHLQNDRIPIWIYIFICIIFSSIFTNKIVLHLYNNLQQSIPELQDIIYLLTVFIQASFITLVNELSEMNCHHTRTLMVNRRKYLHRNIRGYLNCVPKLNGITDCLRVAM